MITTYEYSLLPNASFLLKLEETKELCRDLYNAAIQERRDAWKLNKIGISYKQQSAQLPEIKRLNSDYMEIYSTVVQNVLKRADTSFQNFFRRCRKGDAKVGFPRFKGVNRYDSICYVQSGFRIEGNKLHLSKIGSCRIKLSRPMPNGKIKQCTIKRKLDHWFVTFTIETEFEPLPENNELIAIDAGCEKLLTFSNNEYVENERFYAIEHNETLKKAQQNLSRKKKYSNNWKKAAKRVKRIHRHITNKRKDFLHKLTTAMIKRFGTFVIEDLSIDKLKQMGLGRSISDASWNMLYSFLCYKAERAGRLVKKVKPHYTSQDCICGKRKKKTLRDRVHDCECGIKCDRDLMSALVIKQRVTDCDLSSLRNSAGTALRVFEFNH